MPQAIVKMLKASQIQSDSFEGSGSVRKDHNPSKWLVLDFSEHYHIERYFLEYSLS